MTDPCDGASHLRSSVDRDEGVRRAIAVRRERHVGFSPDEATATVSVDDQRVARRFVRIRDRHGALVAALDGGYADGQRSAVRAIARRFQ